MIAKLYNYTFDNILPLAWLASVLMLGGAYGFEYIGGLFPCDLCWPQRYAHMAVIIFGGFALFLKKSNNTKWVRFKLMTTFSYFVSAGYSGYHAGVEQKWWEGPDSCTLQTSEVGMSVESFMRSLDSVAFVRCDDIPWDLFGISMAGYNFIISLTLLIMLSLSVVKDLKK
ncbi:MAG: disulfide bond formation protein B [Emcibacteraceae bacterium]|nr:disulfide bond formation protein B [Emcibacteraceae bacterium]MDG1995478.1 disulfide bond formation protein B [Emcibacteraceae bacterium]